MELTHSTAADQAWLQREIDATEAVRAEIEESLQDEATRRVEDCFIKAADIVRRARRERIEERLALQPFDATPLEARSRALHAATPAEKAITRALFLAMEKGTPKSERTARIERMPEYGVLVAQCGGNAAPWLGAKQDLIGEIMEQRW